MHARNLKLRTALVCLIVLMSATAFAADQPAATQSVPPPLYGWVDMHTHPMSHLAFGGKLVHGSRGLVPIQWRDRSEHA